MQFILSASFGYFIVSALNSTALKLECIILYCTLMKVTMWDANLTFHCLTNMNGGECSVGCTCRREGASDYGVASLVVMEITAQ